MISLLCPFPTKSQYLVLLLALYAQNLSIISLDAIF